MTKEEIEWKIIQAVNAGWIKRSKAQKMTFEEKKEWIDEHVI